MTPAEVKQALHAILARSKEVWLAEDREERVKAEPVSTRVKDLINRFLRQLVRWHLFPSIMRAKTFYGTTVYVPMASALPLKAKGFYSGEDLKLTSFIADIIKPGDVFIDGGANYGWYSLFAEALGAEVHSFEPTPKVFKVLEKNSRGKNITPYQAALWRSDGDMTFHDLGDGYDVINTLLDPRRFGWKGSINQYGVKTMTLDDLPRADFIKLDCEGAEYEILAGAKKALNHGPVLVVELAASERETGEWGNLVDLLAKKGYKGYFIDHDLRLRPLAEEGGKAPVINGVFKR